MGKKQISLDDEFFYKLNGEWFHEEYHSYKVFVAPRGGQKNIMGTVVNLPHGAVITFQVSPHSGDEF